MYHLYDISLIRLLFLIVYPSCVIKGRGQKALNKKMSIEEGLEEEESFFANTEPWRGIEDKNLLGTKNLRSKLANVLDPHSRILYPN